MSKNILFLTAPIRSHILPALYLANLLADDFTIYFTVNTKVLEEMVNVRGYNAVFSGNLRVGTGMEDRFTFARDGRTSRWNTIKAILNNDIFYQRQSELYEIANRLNPAAIFIDIFDSTELFALYPKFKDIPIIFVNPMLSTYRIRSYPAIMEGFWPDKQDFEKTKSRPLAQIILKSFLTSPYSQILNFLRGWQFEKLMKLSGLAESHPVAKDGTRTILFEGFEECVMAPLELEFSPEIQKSNQTYFGLCISEERQEIELDQAFDGCMQLLLSKKSNSEKIIYCAFGTYYTGNFQPFLIFLNNLLDAVEICNNIQIVISVNSLVIETLRHQRKIPAFVHMFTRVPQLEVLKISNLHITHGGMGSIKESILYAVPMLVYPLEPKWDNNGNALKVEFHGLGLRGSMLWEKSAEMNKKIMRLLSQESFIQNLLLFREKIFKFNNSYILRERLRRLIEGSHKQTIGAN